MTTSNLAARPPYAKITFRILERCSHNKAKLHSGNRGRSLTRFPSWLQSGRCANPLCRILAPWYPSLHTCEQEMQCSSGYANSACVLTFSPIALTRSLPMSTDQTIHKYGPGLNNPPRTVGTV